MAFSHFSGSFAPTVASRVVDAITSPSFKPPEGYAPVSASQFASDLKNEISNPRSSSLSNEDLAYYATWGQGGDSVANPAAASNLDPYPFAHISKLYNTDAQTAYQEALSNTAVQRQMDDFKRAGLNPVLATRYGGADGVGLVGNVAGVGAGYANTSGATAGGGSGYSSPGSTSGRGGSAAGISSILNYASKNYNIQSAVASLASAATFGITKSFQGSAAVYYGVKGAFGVLNSLKK